MSMGHRVLPKSVRRGDPGHSRRQAAPAGCEHLPARGEHAQGTPGTAIDHGLSIDKDLELAVMTANHLDLDPQVASKPGHHPGGMQPGDSVGAISNGDSTHDDLSRRNLAILGLPPKDDRGRPWCHSFPGSELLGTEGPSSPYPGVALKRNRPAWSVEEFPIAPPAPGPR